MATRHRNDKPTLDDRLDRIGLVHAVAEQIATCEPPVTFGVHGDWGAGKTSFLQQLQVHLSGVSSPGVGGLTLDDEALKQRLKPGTYESAIVTVWFEAWRYQYEQAPVVALLREMRRQFGHWEKIKRGGKKLGEVAFRSVLNSVGEVAKKVIGAEALPGAKDVQAIGEQWERDHLEQELVTDTVTQFLEDAIDSLLRGLLAKAVVDGGKARVVVIIDDLDRCDQAAAYRLLEGLKIYLNLRNCVFVLGMNQQVVIDAIALVMSKGEIKPDTPTRAEAYLEKLCTNIWRLPVMSDPATVLKEWLEPQPFADKLAGAVNAAGVRCLPPNPRRLKALANLLNRFYAQLDSNLLSEESNTALPNLWLRVLATGYIYQFHSELFQRWQYDPDFYQQIRQWVQGAEMKEECFKRLRLPIAVTTASGTSPTPQMTVTSTFPDPASPEMFWIAPLIGYLHPGARPENFHSLLRLAPR